MLSHEKFQLVSSNGESSSQNDSTAESDDDDEQYSSSSSSDLNISNISDHGTIVEDETYEVDDRCFDDDTEHEYIDEEGQYDLIEAEEVDEIGEIEVIKCAAHTLALGVDDTVTKLKSKVMFQKFRKLAKFLRTPSQLIKLKRKKLSLPKLDTATRWNSSYDLIHSLVKVQSHCQQENIKILSESNWEWGKRFLLVFKSAKICTKKLQGEQVTLADFFKIWIELMLRVKKMSENEPMARELYKNLKDRQENLFFDNKALQAALYLDPRFRQIFTKIDPINFSETVAQKHLFDVFKNLKRVDVSNPVPYNVVMVVWLDPSFYVNFRISIYSLL